MATSSRVASDQSIFYPLPAEAGFCAVIPKFLSLEECAALIAESETRGFGTAQTDYPPSYRNNDRQVLDDDYLAGHLFPRLQQYAPTEWSEVDVQGKIQRWRLDTINARFRFCRYRPGQRFNLHQDGIYYRGSGFRSCLTFMVYLTNGTDFKGGDTIFYSAGPSGDADEKPTHEIGRVRPQAGTLILFDHRIWHAGDLVTSGVKHIMRSDLMYRLANSPAETDVASAPSYHQGYIWTLASIGNGLIASGGRDTFIHLWGPDGKHRGQLEGHRQSVLGLAALEENRLASVSRDRSLKIWDCKTGECEHSIHAHDTAILSLCAVPGGKIATCGADGLIKIWNNRGRLLGTLVGHSSWVWEVAMLGSDALGSVSEDGHMKIWDLGSLHCIADLAGPIPLLSLAVMPSGDSILAGDMAGQVSCWRRDFSGWKLETRYQMHSAAVRRVRPLDVRRIATCGEDNAVRVWDIAENRLIGEVRHENFATDVLAISDGFVSSAYDGKLRFSCSDFLC